MSFSALTHPVRLVLVYISYTVFNDIDEQILRGLFSKLVPQIPKNASNNSAVSANKGDQSRREDANEDTTAEGRSISHLGMQAAANTTAYCTNAVAPIEDDAQDAEKAKHEAEVGEHRDG
jgi:hypothetical protein